MKIKIKIYLLIICCGIFVLPSLSPATQGHSGIEGVYAHQIGHILFMVSMGVLVYWLRARKLVQTTGWRFIQYSALFFILWNLDTITVHALDDQFRFIEAQTIGIWRIQITNSFGHNFLNILYYVIKLDHLLCVPALLFLYLGLRRLIGETKRGMSGEGRA